MATPGTQTGRTFTRHVAPFAPLALALLMNGAPSNRPGAANAQPHAQQAASAERETTTAQGAICEEVADFQDCHSRYPSGCSAAGGYDVSLNLLKNVLTPASTPVSYLTRQDYANLDAHIPAGLTSTNHGQFEDQLKQMGEGNVYGLIGYLYYSQHTTAESSNCDLTGPPGDPEYANVDYHIGIGFDPTVAQSLQGGAPSAAAEAAATLAKRKPKPKPTPGGGNSFLTLQQNSVIVEMTPHYRFQFEPGTWTYDNLQKVTGKQVMVVGQLIIDNEHNLPSQNCATATTAAQKQTCWRASVWELHPVMRFQVCSKPTNDCSANDSAGWVELDQL